MILHDTVMHYFITICVLPTVQVCLRLGLEFVSGLWYEGLGPYSFRTFCTRTSYWGLGLKHSALGTRPALGPLSPRSTLHWRLRSQLQHC